MTRTDLRRLTDLSPSERWDWLLDRYDDGNQTKFAERIGAKREQISRWAGGEMVPARPNALKIAELSGTPVELWQERERTWLARQMRLLRADVTAIRDGLLGTLPEDPEGLRGELVALAAVVDQLVNRDEQGTTQAGDGDS